MYKKIISENIGYEMEVVLYTFTDGKRKEC